MASYIDCVVDTKPMAHEIDKVSHHVTATTTAVVAMKTAVIAAEKEASDHVCEKVNQGFYTMIRSQISQKMAKLQSDVDSLLMQLAQQQKQLLGIRTRMERDYNMLLARYSKLFTGLNQNLKQRVAELDRPTMNFALGEVEHITNRSKLLTATVPVGQLESVMQSQQILASNAKYQGMKVINTMRDFLSDFNDQRRLTSTILLSGEARESHLAVPVVMMETCIDRNGTTVENIVMNDTGLSASMQRSIQNTITSTEDNLPWVDTTDKDRETINEYGKMVASANLPDRVKEMMNNLFRAASYQTLKQ
ncbi:MAG: hypothetical protein IKP83_02095 [Bacteroidales bacterium]|nr:hypothetical protein [Bacteroidales bacterium]